mgnify:CR=1 FL=1
MSNLSFIIKAILEIEGDTLFVNLLVCLVVDSHILRVLCIEGVILCTNLDVFELHAVSTVLPSGNLESLHIIA